MAIQFHNIKARNTSLIFIKKNQILTNENIFQFSFAILYFTVVVKIKQSKQSHYRGLF